MEADLSLKVPLQGRKHVSPCAPAYMMHAQRKEATGGEPTPHAHAMAKTCATQSCIRTILNHVGQAEVSDFHVMRRIKQEVLRLQIAVHHHELMAVFDAGHDLLEKPAGLLL